MALKKAAKNWCREILLSSGAMPLASRALPPQAVILCYHSVVEHPEEYADTIGLGIIHSAELFKRQMELISRKFKPVTLQDILLFVRGEKSLPRRAVAVTFDDGYQDNFEIAEPILWRCGISASFYLTVGLIGTTKVPWFNRLRHAFATTRRREWRCRSQAWTLSTREERETALQNGFDLCSSLSEDACEETVRSIESALDVQPFCPKRPLMMNWEQAKRIREAGHIIGSHTMSHPNLAHLGSHQALTRELVESKSMIEQEMGFSAEHFSYPHPALHPQWTNQTLASTREAGYSTAVTTDPGPVRRHSNLLSLKRMIVPRREEDFLWRLERTFLGGRLPVFTAVRTE